jgi:acyl-lipid omega-6 desaturase (Delta-12 desaturase)
MKDFALKKRTDFILHHLGDGKWKEHFLEFAQSDDRKAYRQIGWTLCWFVLSGVAALVVVKLASDQLGFWPGIGVALPITFLWALFRTRLFSLQHDCGHDSLFSTKEKNERWMGILSVITWISVPWSGVHAIHHMTNADLGYSDIGDIELLTEKNFPSLPPWKKLYYFLHRHPLFLCIVVGTLYITIYERLRFDLFKEKVREFKKVPKIRSMLHERSPTRTNILILLIYGGLAFLLEGAWGIGWHFVVLLFISNVIWGSIAFWFFFLQHQDETLLKLSQSKIAGFTRNGLSGKGNMHLLVSILGSTYYKVPGWMRYFVADITFHPLHHLLENIPNYRLKAAWEKLKDLIPETEAVITTLTIKSSLRLITKWHVLFDTESDRMITTREFFFNKKYRKLLTYRSER